MSRYVIIPTASKKINILNTHTPSRFKTNMNNSIANEPGYQAFLKQLEEASCKRTREQIIKKEGAYWDHKIAAANAKARAEKLHAEAREKAAAKAAREEQRSREFQKQCAAERKTLEEMRERTVDIKVARTALRATADSLPNASEQGRVVTLNKLRSMIEEFVRMPYGCAHYPEFHVDGLKTLSWDQSSVDKRTLLGQMVYDEMKRMLLKKQAISVAEALFEKMTTNTGDAIRIHGVIRKGENFVPMMTSVVVMRAGDVCVTVNGSIYRLVDSL